MTTIQALGFSFFFCPSQQIVRSSRKGQCSQSQCPKCRAGSRPRVGPCRLIPSPLLPSPLHVGAITPMRGTYWLHPPSMRQASAGRAQRWREWHCRMSCCQETPGGSKDPLPELGGNDGLVWRACGPRWAFVGFWAGDGGVATVSSSGRKGSVEYGSCVSFFPLTPYMPK